MKKKFLKKIFSFIAISSLILQSVSPFTVLTPKAYAEEESTTTTVAEETTTTTTISEEATTTTIPAENALLAPQESTQEETTTTLQSFQEKVGDQNISETTTTVETQTSNITTTGNEALEVAILDNVSAPTIDLDAVVSEESAVLTTDKLDYAPTDTALITGENLIPSTKYQLLISSSNSPPVNFETEVTSDENGIFMYAYQLDGNYRPNYTVDLKDQAGNIVASTDFTDSRWVIEAFLNGNSSTTVYPGDTVSATVRVLTWQGLFDSNDNWRSTSYKVGSGASICENTVNHNNSDIHTETFNFTAPSDLGVHNVTFNAYSDNNCNSGLINIPYVLINGLNIIDFPKGSITITKEVIPDDSSTWNFTVSGTGGTYTYNGLGNGESYTFTNLTPGSYNITETTDSNYTTTVTCGGVGPLSQNAFFGTVVSGQDLACTFKNTLKDKIPPPIPAHVSPLNNSFKTTANQTLIDWESVPDPSAPVTYEYQSSHSNSINPDGSFVLPAYTSGVLALSQIPTGGTPEGVYYWHVRAKDNAGNYSGWSIPWKITIDNTTPAKPTGLKRITPDETKEYACGAIVQRQTLYPVWNDMSTGDPSFDHYEYVSFTPSGSIGTEKNLTINKFIHSWIPTSDGTNGFAVRSVDKAGNVSEWALAGKSLAGSCQITYDSTAPTVPTISGFLNPSLPCGVVTNIKTVTVDWTDGSDANGIAGYDYSIDYPLASGTGRGTWNTFFTQSQYRGSLNEGTHYVRVRAKDKAGNLSDWSNTCSITYDSIAPTATVIYSTTDWTRDDVIATINPSEPVTITNNGGLDYFVFDTNGSFAFEFVDAAGNIGSAVATVNNIDKKGPTEPVADPPAGDYDSDQVVTLSSSDSGSGLDKIYYTLDGTTPDDTKTEYTGTPINIDHDLTLKAIAYDTLGNASTILVAHYGIPPRISDESFVRADDNSLIITWTTDDLSTSRVIYDTVSHPDPLDLATGPNYGYAYSTPTYDEDPKVTSHSVTITGVNVNQTYYYRVISHGSPEAVGGENPFATSYIFGLTGDGLSDGKSDGGSSGGGAAPSAVLGVSTIAYTGTPGTGGQVLGEETESTEEVLGTESASPTPEVAGVNTSNPEQQSFAGAITRYRIVISLIFVAVILLLLYFLFFKKKNKE